MSSPRTVTWRIEQDIVERQAAAVCDPNEQIRKAIFKTLIRIRQRVVPDAVENLQVPLPSPQGTAWPTRGSVPTLVGMSSHSILLHGRSECDDAYRLEDVHGRRRAKTHASECGYGLLSDLDQPIILHASAGEQSSHLRLADYLPAHESTPHAEPLRPVHPSVVGHPYPCDRPFCSDTEQVLPAIHVVVEPGNADAEQGGDVPHGCIFRTHFQDGIGDSRCVDPWRSADTPFLCVDITGIVWHGTYGRTPMLGVGSKGPSKRALLNTNPSSIAFRSWRGSITSS
jgi:hypothetical protein